MAAFRNKSNFAAPDPNSSIVFRILSATDGKAHLLRQRLRRFLVPHAHDGSVAWRFRLTPGTQESGSAPALHSGKVYFGSYDGNVYCLDPRLARKWWRFIGADWVGSSPALAPELGSALIGLEFAGRGKRGSVVALDLESGEKAWEHMTNATRMPPPPTGRSGSWWHAAVMTTRCSSSTPEAARCAGDSRQKAQSAMLGF